MATDVLIHSPYQDKDDPWSSHSVIREWMQHFPTETRVLDVGCATGTLGRLCSDRGLVLNGLEPNPQWAEYARPYYTQLLTGTVEEAPDAFLAGHQVVVCADVLEHLPQPEKLLRRLVALQPTGAIFVISVPNIANLWVRLSLLAGRFNYTERGILDRTHLRFFTRQTLVEFLKDCGLTVEQIQPTPIPLPLVSPFFQTSGAGRALHRALAAATRLFPTLLGYQFVAYCRKGK